MLLDQLTRQFPHKVPQAAVAAPVEGGEAAQGGGASEVAGSVKSEKVEGGSVKRERQGDSKPDSNTKKIKVER